jgi:hypothetical protein
MPETPIGEAALRQLVDDYRTRCLWFLKDDYYPVTAAQRERVLAAIERHGDLEAFHRVAALRAWLLQHSNDASVAS